jgi:hypothetical protein
MLSIIPVCYCLDQFKAFSNRFSLFMTRMLVCDRTLRQHVLSWWNLLVDHLSWPQIFPVEATIGGKGRNRSAAPAVLAAATNTARHPSRRLLRARRISKVVTVHQKIGAGGDEHVRCAGSRGMVMVPHPSPRAAPPFRSRAWCHGRGMATSIGCQGG